MKRFKILIQRLRLKGLQGLFEVFCQALHRASEALLALLLWGVWGSIGPRVDVVHQQQISFEQSGSSGSLRNHESKNDPGPEAFWICVHGINGDRSASCTAFLSRGKKIKDIEFTVILNFKGYLIYLQVIHIG